jgi:hypothetical protein
MRRVLLILVLVALFVMVIALAWTNSPANDRTGEIREVLTQQSMDAPE